MENSPPILKGFLSIQVFERTIW